VGVDQARNDESTVEIEALLTRLPLERTAAGDDALALDTQVGGLDVRWIEGRERRAPKEHPPRF
jgi:hypothetical protein